MYRYIFVIFQCVKFKIRLYLSLIHTTDQSRCSHAVQSISKKLEPMTNIAKKYYCKNGQEHSRERNWRSVFKKRSFLLVALIDAVFTATSNISPVEREKHGYRCSFGRFFARITRKCWKMEKNSGRSFRWWTSSFSILVCLGKRNRMLNFFHFFVLDTVKSITSCTNSIRINQLR